MRRLLNRHPDSPCAAVTRIEALATRPRAGVLALSYLVTGAIRELLVPSAAASVRADELWRHTCFEAFVRAPVGEGYYEFNFSPSTQWAAYRFDGYRQGMRPAEGIGAPQIEVRSTAESFEMDVALALPVSLVDEPWRLGLSAVIEAAEGRMSYWALAHPPGKADFHHADGFALELPVTERP